MHTTYMRMSLECMTEYQIQAYLNSIFDIISGPNKYFSDQKPWELDKDDPDRMHTVLWVTCESSSYQLNIITASYN